MSLAIVTLTAPVTGNAVADAVSVAVVKTSGVYNGFTAFGSVLPGPDGHGSVTFHLGTGAGDYSVILTGSRFGHIQCATFTLR